MFERRKPILVQEAIKRVMNRVKLGDTETIPLEEANGRYLVNPVTADHDVPPFDRSPYDGFAILAEDTAQAHRDTPVTLKVIESIGAGDVAQKEVKNGTTIRIMTGAKLPKNANAIVMFEQAKEEAEQDGSPLIRIQRPFYIGDNISRQGEDIKQGSPILTSGTRITPGVSAVLATFGYANVTVYSQPKVGIIATGSELLEITEPLELGKIRNSNAYMIRSQIERVGGKAIYFGQLKDDFESSFQLIVEALKSVDILITTGGVSVGDFDYLPAIYERLGANILFNKIGMRPGSVTTVAHTEKKILFGLSGNPSACFVGFELYAAPFIKKMQGSRKPYLESRLGYLTKDFPKPNPFTRFVRVFSEFEDGKWRVDPVGLDKANVVTSLASANSLMVLPGGTRGFSTGDQVETLLLEGTGSEHFLK